MKTNASLNRYLAVPFAVMLFMLLAFSSDNESPDIKLNETWRIRKTPAFDVLYPAEFQRDISVIMETVSRSYARCSNLLQYKSSRVIRVIVCPGNSRQIPAGYSLPPVYYAEAANDVRIPFCSSDELLSRVCLYGMSQALLKDFLGKGPLTATFPEWLREGLARYAAFGMDREAFSLFSSRIVCGSRSGIANIDRERGPFMRAGLTRCFLYYLDSSFEAGSVSRFFGQMRQGKGVAGSIEAVCGISFDEFNHGLVAFYKKKRGDAETSSAQENGRACAANPDGFTVSVPLYVNETGPQTICLERGLESCIISEALSLSGADGKTRVIASFKTDELYDSASDINRCAAVSRNGTVLAYARSTADGERIIIAALPGGDVLAERTMPFRAVYDLALSPAGDMLVFSGFTARASDLYCFSWKKPDLRRLTSDDALERYPAFAPSGVSIVYSRRKSRRESDSVYSLFRVGLNGGEPQPLYYSGGSDIHPCVCENGDAIIFVSKTETKSVLMKYDTRVKSSIVLHAATDSFFPLATDGGGIVFFDPLNGRRSLSGGLKP